MLPLLTAGAAPDDLLPDTYAAEALLRAYWRTSDRLRDDAGLRYGEAKDGDNRPIIPRHPREDEGKGSRWEARQQGCRPQAYVRQIADHYVSQVCRARVTRAIADGAALPDQLTALIKDADGVGTGLDLVLRAAARLAFVERVAYLFVDWTGDGGAESQADQAGARFVVRVVSADDVLAVERTQAGIVLAAILLLPLPDGTTRIVRVDGETMQVADLVDGKLGAASDPKPHSLGGCPLIQLGPAPAIIPAVAECQQSIAISDSLLRFRNGEDAVPWIVVTGTTNAAGFVAELAKNPTFSAFEDANTKAQHIGSDVAVAESLRKTITDDEERLYRAAKVRPVGAQGAPESGIAHAYRFVDADAELATLAGMIEGAERSLWARWCVGLGLAADLLTVTWPRTFVPVDRGAEIDHLMLVSASTLPEPIKQREYRRAAVTLYPDDPALVDELQGISDPAQAGT
jgi:hypothetical protein